MTDSHLPERAAIAAHEPAQDAQLAALLQDVVGVPPVDAVQWSTLAHRISAAVAAHRSAPWWSYAARWERRALPIAIAAGLAGAIGLWSTRPAPASTASHDLVTAVASGTSAADAASTLAHSFTATGDITAELPE